MLLEYIQAAILHAQYKILPDDRSYIGAIVECAGAFANVDRLEERREQPREVLEEWGLFRVHKNLALPVIDGIEPVVKAAACADSGTNQKERLGLPPPSIK